MSDAPQEETRPVPEAKPGDENQDRGRENEPPQHALAQNQGRMLQAFGIEMKKHAAQLELREKRKEVEQMHHPAKQIAPERQAKKWKRPKNMYINELNIQPSHRGTTH